MIKYFCDRCGKEISLVRGDKEILLLDCTPKYYVPTEWEGKTWHKILCNDCFVAFDYWLDETKMKEQDT